MQRGKLLFAAVVAAGFGACTSEATRDGTPNSGGLTTLGAEGTDDAADESDTEDEDAGEGGDAADDDGTVTYDVGAPGDDGELPPVDDSACKIDFLFVIDNSDSMANKQEQLVGAFPGFMATIDSNIADGTDVHLLVTDTDAWGKCYDGNCGGEVCNDPVAGNYICNFDLFDECDRTQGAGVVHPAGRFATNAPCTVFGGNRYMISGEPDPTGTFTCMATVGTAGDGRERPMESIVAALSPEINAAGGCNDGFLRDDAILVITFISDDPWDEDAGDPQSWYDAVVQAKNGDPEAAVVLGLTPAWDGCRDGKGPPKGEHWKEFIEKFGDHGLHGNVCDDAQQYVTFFEQAVGVIDQTCATFEPPG